MRRLTGLLVALAMLAGGCAGPSAPSPSPSVPVAPPTNASATVPASAAPTASETASTAPTPAECASRIVEDMPMAERIGQLVMVGVTGASAAELAVLRRLRIGSVILMGTHAAGVGLSAGRPHGWSGPRAARRSWSPSTRRAAWCSG